MNWGYPKTYCYYTSGMGFFPGNISNNISQMLLYSQNAYNLNNFNNGFTWILSLIIMYF